MWGGGAADLDEESHMGAPADALTAGSPEPRGGSPQPHEPHEPHGQEEMAAIRIQAIKRGQAARRHQEQQRREQQQARRDESSKSMLHKDIQAAAGAEAEAATKIQSILRGKSARERQKPTRSLTFRRIEEKKRVDAIVHGRVSGWLLPVIGQS